VLASYARMDLTSLVAGGDVSLAAERAIVEIYAGGTVTATLTAPEIGSMHEHDRTKFSGWPEPRSGRFGELVTAVADMQHAAALGPEKGTGVFSALPRNAAGSPVGSLRSLLHPGSLSPPRDHLGRGYAR
jgi:hypothetical protein